MEAEEKLKTLVEKRKWYGDKIERRKANAYKSLLKKNKLSLTKTREILFILGYKPKQKELW